MDKERATNSGNILYIRLYEVLKSEIILKKLKPYSKFYSVRQIAIKYDVNKNTVLKVFKMLEENGYIYSINGKGSYVKDHADFSISEKVIPIMENFRYGQQNEISEINFFNGTPSKDMFPVDIYLNLAERAIREIGGGLFTYQNVQGLKSFRAVLADYIEKYDIFVDSEDIIITSGTQQSLSVIFKAFGCHPEKTIVISDPTYPNAINFFEDMYNIRTMELENDGWNMESFEELIKKEKIDLVYIIPNFQNPTGIIWSTEKKKKLLKLSKEYDFYIIEDDCFSEFYYGLDDGDEICSIKSMDKIGDERVIYVKTYSKIVMPGIALAFTIPPKKFMEKFVLTKYGLDPNTSGLNQKILEYFILDGYLDKHLEKSKEILSVKFEKMLSLLLKIPHIKISNIPRGGFFIWIELVDCIDGEIFYYNCKLKGLSVLPGSIFHYNKRNSCKIRLSFLSATLEEIEIGVKIMEDILKNYKI
ncbi:MAG: PLP-dependent aminotransferase family protein [Fusobacteriaceae bacterium]|nr:PLP-dependent aminotransferase family protein [Fusobacteriaceae bacterium]